jgi:hypothetical protein
MKPERRTAVAQTAIRILASRAMLAVTILHSRFAIERLPFLGAKCVSVAARKQIDLDQIRRFLMMHSARVFLSRV